MIMEWPQLGKYVRFKLLEDKNPIVCEEIRKQLPVVSIQSHAVVCGKQMYCPFLYTKDSGNAFYEDMSKQPEGRINLELKFLYLSVNYDVQHESIPTCPIGQVEEEDMHILKEVGEKIWYNLMYSDEYIKVIIREEE